MVSTLAAIDRMPADVMRWPRKLSLLTANTYFAAWMLMTVSKSLEDDVQMLMESGLVGTGNQHVVDVDRKNEQQIMEQVAHRPLE